LALNQSSRKVDLPSQAQKETGMGRPLVCCTVALARLAALYCGGVVDVVEVVVVDAGL
jgi:hypothetical protein